MAGEIDFNGFRVQVYDKRTKKQLTDCTVIATHNGVKYTVPYVQSENRYQLEVASVGPRDSFTVEVTRDGYIKYNASSNTGTITQVYISTIVPVLQQCDEILASKAAIKAAIQYMGVSCDDTLAEYANRNKAIIVEPKEIDVPIDTIAVGTTFTIDASIDVLYMDLQYYPIICVGENYTGMSIILSHEFVDFPHYCILEETRDSHYVVKLECPDNITVSGTILKKVEEE